MSRRPLLFAAGLTSMLLVGMASSTEAFAAKVTIGVWHYSSGSYPSAPKIKTAYEASYGSGNVTVTSVSFDQTKWPTLADMKGYDVVIVNRYARSAPYVTANGKAFEDYIAAGGHAVIIGEQEGLSGRLFPYLLSKYGLVGSGTNSSKPNTHSPLSPSAMNTASGTIKSTGSFETYSKVKACFATYDSYSEYIFPGTKPGDGSLTISGEVQRFSSLSSYSGDDKYIAGIAKMHHAHLEGSLADMYALDTTGIINPKHKDYPCDPSYVPPCTKPTLWYLDADKDTWGLSGVTKSACKAPVGYVAKSGDCDDKNAAINPGATEIVGDNVDQNCDLKEICYRDADNDGYRLTSTLVSADADCNDTGEARAAEPAGDCNDSNAAIKPGATEGIADEVDQNCDGREVCYLDNDNDNYRPGTGSATMVSADVDCRDSREALKSDKVGDCNDSNAAINPGASEIAGDNVDQNCDLKEICYRDADDDGYRTSTVFVSADADCNDSGEALAKEPGGDCDDKLVAINPGAKEGIGDEVDQNCDGREICYLDNDNDSYRPGAGTATLVSADADCTDPREGLARDKTGDCDDKDAATYPGAFEVVADGKDQSCDGKEVCYQDLDSDMWRTDTTRISADGDCADAGEALASLPSVDCDDADKTVYPGAKEIVADGKDQSCDGKEICYEDIDNDGWRTGITSVSADEDCSDSGEGLASDPDGDCDDDDAGVYPGATEIAYDGKDQDCDGDDLCDVDEDGFAASMGSCAGSDCDDTDDTVNPAADESWYDGVDQDCDGWSDFDADYDGFDSADYEGDDCDDADDSVNPDADEVWYDGIDQNCDEASDYDMDGDGYDSAEYGGEDCDDDDDTIYPGADELDDGIDNDCNGIDEDLDSDEDGLTDEDELDIGTDPHNPDSDGDGLLDGVEVGDDTDNPDDSDGDGVIDALDVDDDGDGIETADELGDEEDGVDSDGDGVPDYLDLDSDDDGFTDEEEGIVDTDLDGVSDYLDLDSDDDTVLDSEEEHDDTDGDDLTDRVDPDDDGDGFSTIEERSWDDQDIDDDDVVNHLDPDSDGDGDNDVDEGRNDDDCDGIPNVQDADDLDGACGSADGLSYQSGACAGGSTVGTTGQAGLLLGLFGLLGLRRRRR